MALTVLRYFGSKNKVAREVIAHFPAHTTYVEPFGGSAAILLNKAPSKLEIYNDLDGQVVNLFRVLRDPDQANRLIDMVALTPWSRVEWEQSWGKFADDPVEAAWQLLVRGWMGQHSAASTGQWRTGWSWYKTDNGGRKVNNWHRLPLELDRAVARLRLVQIDCRPAIEVIQKCDSPNTLFYLDPPYPAATRSKWSKTSYRHEMTDDDHCELARALHGLKGKVVLSSYHGLYDELFADWHVVEITTYSDGRSTRRKRTEVLYLSPNCERMQFAI